MDDAVKEVLLNISREIHALRRKHVMSEFKYNKNQFRLLISRIYIHIAPVIENYLQHDGYAYFSIPLIQHFSILLSEIDTFSDRFSDVNNLLQGWQRSTDRDTFILFNKQIIEYIEAFNPIINVNIKRFTEEDNEGYQLDCQEHEMILSENEVTAQQMASAHYREASRCYMMDDEVYLHREDVMSLSHQLYHRQTVKQAKSIILEEEEVDDLIDALPQVEDDGGEEDSNDDEEEKKKVVASNTNKQPLQPANRRRQSLTGAAAISVDGSDHTNEKEAGILRNSFYLLHSSRRRPSMNANMLFDQLDTDMQPSAGLVRGEPRAHRIDSLPGLRLLDASSIKIEKTLNKGAFGLVCVGTCSALYNLTQQQSDTAEADPEQPEQPEQQALKQVAIKTLAGGLSKDHMQQAFRREALIMQMIDHPNIIKFYGACIDMGNYRLVMELADCSLKECLENEEHPYYFHLVTNVASLGSSSDSNSSCSSVMLAIKVKLLYDICNGLKFLHDVGVTHRDIKSANILICVTTTAPSPTAASSAFPSSSSASSSASSLASISYVAKLGDFGLAKSMEVGTATEGHLKGSLAYLAPELMQRHHIHKKKIADRSTPSSPSAAAPSSPSKKAIGLLYSAQTDMYSFGILMNETLMQIPPYQEFFTQHYHWEIFEVMQENPHFRPPLYFAEENFYQTGDGITADLQTMIKDAWQTDAKKRPSFDFLLFRLRSAVHTLHKAAAQRQQQQQQQRSTAQQSPQSAGSGSSSQPMFLAQHPFHYPSISKPSRAPSLETINSNYRNYYHHYNNTSNSNMNNMVSSSGGGGGRSSSCSSGSSGGGGGDSDGGGGGNGGDAAYGSGKLIQFSSATITVNNNNGNGFSIRSNKLQPTSSNTSIMGVGIGMMSRNNGMNSSRKLPHQQSKLTALDPLIESSIQSHSMGGDDSSNQPSPVPPLQSTAEAAAAAAAAHDGEQQDAAYPSPFRRENSSNGAGDSESGSGSPIKSKALHALLSSSTSDRYINKDDDSSA